jgi:hypothetical protein
MSETYDHAAYRREVEQRERREAEALRESTERERAYHAWVQDGGSPADFEREWPKLRTRRIMDADEQAREAQRRAGFSRI